VRLPKSSKPKLNDKSPATAREKLSHGEEAVGKTPIPVGPELFIGLVGAIGTDLDGLTDRLAEALQEVQYRSVVIKLSQHLSELKGFGPYPSDEPVYDRYRKLMKAGTRFRHELTRGDAMALLGVSAVREERHSLTKDRLLPQPRQAYILRQLKHPEEVKTFRRIYGRSFVLFAAYSPRDKRVQSLAERIAISEHNANSDPSRAKAELLIVRDEDEQNLLGGDPKYGQRVQDVFPLADVFVDTSDPQAMTDAIKRAVRLFFGYLVITPSRDEHGMFYAKTAALRSSSLARQVGAALTTDDGDILTVGTNEVPRAGGGLYWEGDDPDDRDFVWRRDVSDEYRRRLVADVLSRLQKAQWLAEKYRATKISDLVELALAAQPGGALRGTRLMDVMEFVRAAHAEMAAISDAARRGISIDKATLYVTTFPCHECARLIVAAGVVRVVFIEPYPKSLAADLYPEAVSVKGDGRVGKHVLFEPFVGIAPRRYMDLFENRGKRKSQDGKLVDWDPSKAIPRIPSDYPLYIPAEQSESDEFEAILALKGLRKRA